MAFSPARIICAVDFSSLTPAAVNLAAQIAQTLEAELFLFHAVFHANDLVRDSNVTGRSNRWQLVHGRACYQSHNWPKPT